MSDEYDLDSDDEIRIIEQVIDAIENGEPGVPLDEAFDSLRKKYGIKPYGDADQDARHQPGA